MAASTLHIHRGHVALLSSPTVHSLYCDLHYKYPHDLFQKKLRTLRRFAKPEIDFRLFVQFFLYTLYILVLIQYVRIDNSRGSRPWRTWLEPRSDFFHPRIFCINLFEAIRLNILRYTLYSYNNKNLGSFMSYFF